MSAGFLIQVASGLWMLTFDLNVTMDILVWNSLVQGFSVGLIWVPLSVVAFDTLAPSDRAEAASVFHLLRNIGSSFFISLSIAEIVRATGANYSRMTEMISPYNTTLSLPWVTGAWDFGSVAGPCQGRQGNQPPGGDDRLPERFHDVLDSLGARTAARADRPAPKEHPGARLRRLANPGHRKSSRPRLIRNTL